MNFEDLIQEDDLLPIEDHNVDTPPTEEPTEGHNDEPNDEPNDNPPVDTDNDDDLKDVITSNFNFLKEVKVLDLPEDFEFDGKPEQLEKALEVTKSKMQKDVAAAL